MKHQRIEYKGKPAIEDCEKFAKMKSEEMGCYVYFTTIFFEVFMYASSTLPKSFHAPNDYPSGYHHKGLKKDWSNSRKIACENACSTRD